jgi:hypothetical protein
MAIACLRLWLRPWLHCERLLHVRNGIRDEACMCTQSTVGCCFIHVQQAQTGQAPGPWARHAPVCCAGMRCQAAECWRLALAYPLLRCLAGNQLSTHTAAPSVLKHDVAKARSAWGNHNGMLPAWQWSTDWHAHRPVRKQMIKYECPLQHK